MLKIKKYSVRRFVHFGVRCIAKYRYGKNSDANPNFKKTLWHFRKWQTVNVFNLKIENEIF
jgi:hypothetical protein